jgi:benzoyl-CoA-dihydrodiol lyase
MGKIQMPVIEFDTHPDTYRHWNLSFDGAIARLEMDVSEVDSVDGSTDLVLNSYDLGVDIELADAISRLRFEHPEVRAVVVTSAKDRVFCAGANIRMLAKADHGFKVNFCKYTNETRLGIEDASAHSSLRFLAALNGTASGGGYELALACDHILLVDDRTSAVSFPEVPLLGVLPGTGGLTRVVDKRLVRRDRADFFSTVAEGIKGRRAVKWNLVDSVAPLSRFPAVVGEQAAKLVESVEKKRTGPGVQLPPLTRTIEEDSWSYDHVNVSLNRDERIATVTLQAPSDVGPTDAQAIREAGTAWWPFALFREWDDALLRLRFNEPLIGTLLIKTAGDMETVLKTDEVLESQKDDWFVNEVRHFIKRVLKRQDMTAKSQYALIEAGSCFGGTLLEVALAADRTYMLDDPDGGIFLATSKLNDCTYPMGNGLSRLQTRFLGEPELISQLLERTGELFDTPEADELGLVTDAPDDLDWDDTIRVGIEERASLSPDALTGMEANLRFAGPETMETKIFGRLTAWQNWIFQRPNAVGPEGALTLYGHPQRPTFSWKRT